MSESVSPAANDADHYADLGGVLAALFSSLLDDEPFASFLDRLSKAAGATWATLILTPRSADEPGMILTPGADPDIGRDYAKRLFAGDPFTGLPEGRVMHFRDVVSDEMLRRNSAYRAFLTQIRSDEVIGVDLTEADGLQLRLRLTRDAGIEAFGPVDAARLQDLVPHLRIALRLFDRLAAGEIEQRIYAGAITRMAVGIIILDRRGKVIRMNARAATLLGEKDGIRLHGDQVTPDNADIARELRNCLKAAALDPPTTWRIERPSGRGDLLLVVGSAQAPDYVTAGGGPAAVLFLNDPASSPEVSAEAVRDLLGLTHSEATIAAAIAGGASLTDAAQQLGVSPNTVRAHLRSIFAKTGVKRQSQLMHLVHHSLPGLSLPNRQP